jgi:hypothetical protein
VLVVVLIIFALIIFVGMKMNDRKIKQNRRKVIRRYKVTNGRMNRCDNRDAPVVSIEMEPMPGTSGGGVTGSGHGSGGSIEGDDSVSSLPLPTLQSKD